MQITVVSSGLSPAFGGAAQSETELARTLARRVDVRLLCPADRFDSDYARRRGVLQFTTPFSRSEVFHLNENTVVNQWLSSTDVVHFNGHWRWENFFICRHLLHRGIPYVYQPRGMCWVGHRKVALKRWFNRILGDSMVRGASRVICLSQFEVTQLSPYGVSPDRIAVVPNGIEIPPSIPSPSGEAPYFLYLGRLESRKNLVELVAAFAQYREGGGKARLRLVGPVERGYDRTIRSAIQAHGVVGAVHVEAPVYDDGKWALMAGATAVIYPSRGEPFGRVPFEAVGAGSLPVIPRESGAAEYLEKFFPSLIFPLGNVTALAGCLNEAEAFSSVSVEDARRWVGDDLSWKSVADRMMDLYGLVLGKGLEGQSTA